jgi:hypothetical protein
MNSASSSDSCIDNDDGVRNLDHTMEVKGLPLNELIDKQKWKNKGKLKVNKN